MEDVDLKDNYIALAMSILTGWTADQCFTYLDTMRRPIQNRNIAEKDIEHMVQLKQQGMTYRQIGEMFGLSSGAVFKRVKRYGQQHERG